MVAYGIGARELVIDGIGKGPYGPVTIGVDEQARDMVGIREPGQCFAPPDERHVIEDKIIVEGIPVKNEGQNKQQKNGNPGIELFF